MKQPQRKRIDVEEVAAALKVPKPNESISTVYLSDGSSLDEDFLDKDLEKHVCAKRVDFKSGNTQYYVKAADHQLFHPDDKDSYYRTKLLWRMLKVDEKTFKLYMKFLDSRKEMYKTQAERNL